LSVFDPEDLATKIGRIRPVDNRNSPPPQVTATARLTPATAQLVPPCPHTVKALADLAQVARQVI
jgi:hypothetical protein